MLCRMVSIQANTGEGYEFEGIFASVVGGVSMAGGEGTIFGAVIGALVVAVLRNGLNLNGINCSGSRSFSVCWCWWLCTWIPERRRKRDPCKACKEGKSVELQLKQQGTYAFDEVSMGEILLRLDPGEGRIKTARHFAAWEGGGEYNVARGLRKCFGMKTSVITAFTNNEVGRLLEDMVSQGGVDTSLIRWLDFDGIGRSSRNAINFTERGFGIRGAVGCPTGRIPPCRIWARRTTILTIFSEPSARAGSHTGGIYAAISEKTNEAVIEAIKTAKKYGRSSPMTSTTGRPCGNPSAARREGNKDCGKHSLLPDSGKRLCSVHREKSTYSERTSSLKAVQVGDMLTFSALCDDMWKGIAHACGGGDMPEDARR